jgi:protein-S-isoprenylcysteine O-methyltransferase Ste14
MEFAMNVTIVVLCVLGAVGAVEAQTQAMRWARAHSIKARAAAAVLALVLLGALATALALATAPGEWQRGALATAMIVTVACGAGASIGALPWLHRLRHRLAARRHS